MRYLLALLAAMLFAVSVEANVVDPSQGLEFLDLTVTKGKSYDTVSGMMLPGQALDGWRWADEAEAIYLINGVGGFMPPVVASGMISRGSDLSELAINLGITGIFPDRFWAAGLTKSGQFSSRPIIIIDLVDGGAEDIVLNNFTVDKSEGDELIGSFLVREVALGYISGFVTDEHHTPIADAKVWFWQDQVKTSTTTDGTGFYVFEGLPSAWYNIVSNATGFPEKVKELTRLKTDAPWGHRSNINIVLR